MNTVISAENEKHEFFQILVHGKMYDIFYILFSPGLVKICDVEAQAKSTVLSAELRNISTTTSATALLLIQ